MSRHRFTEPAATWHVRSGQLLYRAANTTVIGEVLVRSSNAGDFELTFSKGPGITLLSLREDATFAEARGPLAGPGWAGKIANAPKQLHGWLGLRDVIMHARGRHTVRHVSGAEIFLLQF